ncbi:hypothetical protein [Hyperthermus butylicus]|uniref:4Fe-4S ferredoxin protein n=1 Tax=Hyperthermus butylicus (strain DSM 5456 / JCM 9403 / PLM1-5) TaxID=415426 RepID=A2BJK1_HYPBU|nr:hypothetical protein [Hyperthermus butylicus]ABM80162.1 putative 4Fe-4S ferredoxin protein [Hyperthermus butylicus DSM 5456]
MTGEHEERAGYPWVWSTWVKAPILRNRDLLIASACLPFVNPELFRKLAEGKTALLACPERESPAHYGKIASIIRSSKPRSITIVTIDGSPHCFALHASANEAEYILGERVEKKHYVVVNGEELVEISPNAVRVARYLHIVDKIIREHPEIMKELDRVSLEYRQAKKLIGKDEELEEAAANG